MVAWRGGLSTPAGGSASAVSGLVHSRTESDDAATASPVITTAASSQICQVRTVLTGCSFDDVIRSTLGRTEGAMRPIG